MERRFTEFLPLFRQIVDLKRIADAEWGSLAGSTFVRAWRRYLDRESIGDIAESETVKALIASRLGAIDAETMAAGGLTGPEIDEVMRRALESTGFVKEGFHHWLRPARISLSESGPPEFVRRLLRQARAGATHPRAGRIVLVPVENHAEHCATVAIFSFCLAGVYHADPGVAFLTGVAHHLANAWLPDSGDAGDVLLGELGKRMRRHFLNRALAEIPPDLHPPILEALNGVYRADTPEAQTFQAADVMDRVLEMEWHARTADFTLETALRDFEIVHPGPVQDFQQHVLSECGLAKS